MSVRQRFEILPDLLGDHVGDPDVGKRTVDLRVRKGVLHHRQQLELRLERIGELHGRADDLLGMVRKVGRAENLAEIDHWSLRWPGRWRAG